MRSIAADFVTQCFAPDEAIGLLLRRENPISTLQRIVPVERALASRYLAWLAHENATGANVYVAANPLRSGSRRRTKESLAAVRHLYVDIDIDGVARLAALRASDAAPTPNVVLSTSPGKYQVLWQVDIQYLSDYAYSPADFHLDIPTAEATHFTRANVEQENPGRQTHSEHDWAWVSHELAEWNEAAKLTRVLASRRSDKPNPLYYAQQTVYVASARLWLLEGIRINDVITMLEVRRRFEIPNALCSTRAREIALTAQRMIASRKVD
jgi:hypothetical protein